MTKNNFSLRKKIISMLGGAVRNTISLPSEFLRYGTRGKPMYPNWSDVRMSDEEHYKGYGYGAIVRRAVLTAMLGSNNVRTDSQKEGLVHPYLVTLEKSPTFTDFQFWSTISTYLDLEGWFPLMAIRNFDGERKGNITEFKLLNPYQVRRVVRYDENGMTIGGYIESKGGFVREIPPQMIIDIRNLNPFADNIPLAITDAVKDSQFQLRSASEYTRSALRNNINAPGMLSTDVKLEQEDFDNFVARVKEHTKGEPLFGNGSGGLTWTNMETDLTKAALRDINEVSRDEALSTYGVSKTIMGIEQSGTTRETARVQQELIMELQVLPQVQLIIDALNQDYRNNAPNALTSDKLNIVVDNPLATDHDEEIKEIQVKQDKFDLYKTLIDRDVDPKTAANYVNGVIDLDQVPIEPFKLPDFTTPVDKTDKKDLTDQTAHDHLNSLEQDKTGLVSAQSASLKNHIVKIDQQLLIAALKRLPKKMENATELRRKDVVTQAEQTDAERDLALVLLGFYGIVVNLQGQKVMRDRMGMFSLPGIFTFSRDVENIIKKYSSDAAASHIETITNDIYKTASDAAKQGKSLKQVETLLKQKFAVEVSEGRAKVIARSETNRAFTTAQYEADRQFVKQNSLEGRAYKQWVTRSGNPCPICQALADEGPIPLSDNFRNLGDTVEFEGGSFTVGYASLQAGNAHPNCSCTYELVIKGE